MKEEAGIEKRWFSRHIDTIVVIFTVVTGFFMFYNKLDTRISNIEKDMAIVKTILIMKGLAPAEIMAKSDYIPE